MIPPVKRKKKKTNLIQEKVFYLSIHEVLTSDNSHTPSENYIPTPGVVLHGYNPRTWKAEARGS
jgi:hypothetical protein